MRLSLLLLLPVALPLCGQFPVSREREAAAEKAFERQPDERALACRVVPFRPTLSFSFRIQGGYFADIPLKQMPGSRQGVAVLLRITPEGGEQTRPYYFLQRLGFPTIPEKTNAVAQLSGGVYFGEGRYTVDFLATDREDRTCRKQWRVEAKLSGKEKQLKVLQEPYTVQPVVLPQWSGVHASGTEQARTATILLNVAPLRSRSLRLSIFDQALLFGTLKAVLEQGSFTSIRLVAFNLERHKEVFRQEALDPPGFEKLRRAIQDISLATIDVATLKEPKGHLDLLSRLVKEELDAPKPSDAVIFIGPNTRRQDRLPEDWPTATAGAPRFFYLEYAPFLATSFPDVITRAVRSFDGKWYAVHSPQELASALQKMDRALTSAAATAAATPTPATPASR